MFEPINEDHILSAIEQIEANGLGEYPPSKYYDILYEGKKYPPKPVIAIAMQIATGKEVKTTEFNGGNRTPAFKKLRDLGFEIVEKDKDTFSSTLVKFLEQAKTENLKTKEYRKSYLGMDVKVSFGQGNSAKIPWISFLGPGQQTSNGIYPVYLLYKDIGMLILSYGLSESNTPSISWKLDNELTIKNYFESLQYSPDRYGGSFVFKAYDTNNLPTEATLEKDLESIIKQYSKRLKSRKTSQNQSEKFEIKKLENYIYKAGLSYSKQFLARFTSAIISKPFIILTGLSGSGKTKLAQAFIKWICQDESQYAIVPVGADWTNREPLLGFPNALSQNEYVKPESGVLELIHKAKVNDTLPYFLLLDEMNLSHVERYFADFLSVMESGEDIHLHSMDDCDVDPKITIPDNLFIIGTVNIDETTYMFSPKVLDRANTLEFRIRENELQEFLSGNSGLQMEVLEGKGASMAESFVELYRNRKPEKSDSLNGELLKFFKVLKKAGAEFGYRTANEIQILVSQLGIIDNTIEEETKLDIAIMQKLLPKVHGSRRKLEKTLRALSRLCLEGEHDDQKIDQLMSGDKEADKVKYPISFEKIQRMYQGAIDHGFASYAEA